MKKEKIKKIIKKVLFILFVIITCCMWFISLSKCYHNSLNVNHLNDVNNDIKITRDINKARINDGTYTSFNIGYNGDSQDDYILGLYEFDSGQGIYSYVFRLNDFYVNIRDDGSVNDGNIYGFGFNYSYELFSCDTDSYYNHSIEDYGSGDFYVDYNNIDVVPINRAYDLYNANFNLEFTLVNEMINFGWSITLNNGQEWLSSNHTVLFYDLSETFQFYELLLSWDLNYSLPVHQIYYSFNYGNNYQIGYDIGFDEGLTQGLENILNNPNSYDLYTNTQYHDYGESQYIKGYNENSTYSLETEGFLVMFNTIMNAPFNIFGGILNFDLFGVNLFDLFTFIFTVVLATWVIKLFI